MVNFEINSLSLKDYHLGYMDLLSHLTEAPALSFEQFKIIFEKISKDCHIEVIHYQSNLVASGTVFIEQKFIRKGGRVAHIEDIVVHKDYLRSGFGLEIVKHLIHKAKEFNCYKIILDCDEDNVPFYEKLSFKKKGSQMAIYF